MFSFFYNRNQSFIVYIFINVVYDSIPSDLHTCEQHMIVEKPNGIHQTFPRRNFVTQDETIQQNMTNLSVTSCCKLHNRTTCAGTICT